MASCTSSTRYGLAVMIGVIRGRRCEEARVVMEGLWDTIGHVNFDSWAVVREMT